MPASPATYTFLGPEGTFTEAALMQVPGAAAATRIPASNVNAALDMVRDGSADAAMVPIENSVEGGVTATLDAIASGPELRIIREVLVPISFVLVARPGMARHRHPPHLHPRPRVGAVPAVGGRKYSRRRICPRVLYGSRSHGAVGRRTPPTTPRSAHRSSRRNSRAWPFWQRTLATTRVP